MKKETKRKVKEWKKLKLKLDKFIIIYFVLYLIINLLFGFKTIILITSAILFMLMIYMTYYIKNKNERNIQENEDVVKLKKQDILNLLKKYYKNLNYEIFEDKTEKDTLFIEKNDISYKVKILNSNTNLDKFKVSNKELIEKNISKILLVINKNIDKKIKKEFLKQNIFLLDSTSLKFIKYKVERSLKSESIER